MNNYIIPALWFIAMTAVLALALSTAYCAPSAYPDGFQYYDGQYSPYPSKQPQFLERITPVVPGLNDEYYTLDGQHLECKQLPNNETSCQEY